MRTIIIIFFAATCGFAQVKVKTHADSLAELPLWIRAKMQTTERRDSIIEVRRKTHPDFKRSPANKAYITEQKKKKKPVRS